MSHTPSIEQYQSLVRDTRIYLEENPVAYLYLEENYLKHFTSAVPKLKPTPTSEPIPVKEISPPQTKPKPPVKQAQSKPIEPSKPAAVKIEPKPEKKLAPPKPKVSLKPERTKLNASQKPSLDFMAHLETIIPQVLPEIRLSQTKPNDAEARKVAERWQYEMQAAEISILSSTRVPEEKKFLANLAQALSVTFAPARVIDSVNLEKAGEWDSFLSASQLQLILANDHEIWRLKNLMTHYKENPSQRKAFLDKVPLFMLPDLSLYFKDPQLKRSLWKALCQRMQNLDL